MKTGDKEFGRGVSPERAAKILDATTKADAQTSEQYLAEIQAPGGLERFLKQNRAPLVLFYPQHGEGLVHIVFPPAAYVSPRGYQQHITDIQKNFNTENRYVFHSSRLRGPKTESSFAVVGVEQGLELLRRMIKIFNEQNQTEKATGLQEYLYSSMNITISRTPRY